MDKITLVKKIATPVIGWSVSFVVANIIRNNVLPKSRLQNAEIWIASLVVGAMVAEHAEKYFQKEIDRAVETWNQFKKSNP